MERKEVGRDMKEYPIIKKVFSFQYSLRAVWLYELEAITPTLHYSILLLWLFPALLLCSDWAQYRGNAARSGYTEESLPHELSIQWVYKSRYAPHPAWSGRDTRMPFDRVFHTVIKDGILYFGSSADCRVYSLDAATGKELWTFLTKAPVRFAPAVWHDRVFAASDDGYLYCLSAKQGKVLWKKRGGPKDNMVLGNDRMMSRWPVRGGPVVFDDTVYFGAGIWPSEGIYMYALDAKTGNVLWVNDKSGGIVMEQPHGGNRAKSGISAQGYLAADRERVYVPTGRGVPAVFDRLTGKLLYFHLAKNAKIGGSDIAVSGDVFINGGLRSISSGYRSCGYDVKTGVRKKGVKIRSVNRFASGTVSWGPQIICADKFRVHSSGKKGIPSENLSMTDMTSAKQVWNFKVEGRAWGFAAANNRLYVSTDKGMIYCFGKGTTGKKTPIGPSIDRSPYGRNKEYIQAALEIIKTAGIHSGFCLDLGCGEGALSYELAKRTKLSIYAIEKDPVKAALARRKLDAAGLYGVRVTVHCDNPSKIPYPDYFANLIVSGRSVISGSGAVNTKEILRVLRPYGGISLVGKPGSMKKTVRGPLKGAGEWTHQYADPANTVCSGDRLIKGPFKMLWFTDFNFEMPNRHGRGPAPLFKNGYLVVEGLHGLLCVDAYNGHRIWRHSVQNILKPYHQEHLLGAAFTQSNMCAADDCVYFAAGTRCLRIDIATGKKKQEYSIPEAAETKDGKWGYIACENGILYGSIVNRKHTVRYLFGRSDMSSLFTESSTLFGLDIETGKPEWMYKAKHSVRHNTITVGRGRIYFIDRELDTQDNLASRKVKRVKEKSMSLSGALICLDSSNGKVIWQRSDKDIHGTTLSLSTANNLILMGYTFSQRKFQLPSEWGDRLTALRASDGRTVWDTKIRYRSRPLIIDRTVYAQPSALDLMTGQKLKNFRMRGRGPGGCGTISGSPNLLVYRSGTLGYTDLLTGDQNTKNYGGARPGCWINAVPAGGLVLMPDATDLCTCSYLIKASYALQPEGKD